ncbi:MAG: PrsW family intramembrane metalloprotease [Chloroflexi bacterium]|nr:PrsW family intramembrane metalloprotease [Chloroflexota bacterium]
MRYLTEPMPKSWKTAILIAGLVLFVPGIIIAMPYACLVPLTILSSRHDALTIGMTSFALLVLTFGAGGVVVLHALQCLQGKASRPLRLPPAWMMAGIFGLCIFAGIVTRTNETLAAFFFPPILFIAAAMSPLLAMAWFAYPRAEGLTFRRALVAFAGGATVSVLIALALEIVLPLTVLALIGNLSNIVVKSVENLLADLAGRQIARALTTPGFVYAFIQVAVIAPLAEEIAKPLVTLPILGRLSRRDAFLVAAMAGAGFATLENVLYTSFGAYLWSGVLVLRAIGGALHPLGAGLVGLSWRDILNGERDAWRYGFARFGIAVGIHALWNGGTLIVLTLAGAQFFGATPPKLDVLGLSAAGTTLALVIVLGLAALWMGRTVVRGTRLAFEIESEGEAQFVVSDRAVTIWAFVCLVAIVPVGVTALRALLR